MSLHTLHIMLCIYIPLLLVCVSFVVFVFICSVLCMLSVHFPYYIGVIIYNSFSCVLMIIERIIIYVINIIIIIIIFQSFVQINLTIVLNDRKLTIIIIN